MQKKSFAATVSGICTVVFVTLITVLADLAPALKNWLRDTFTHHWIGKGVLAAGLYVLIYLLVVKTARKLPEDGGVPLLRALSFAAIFGAAAIFGFFLWETIGK